MLPVQSDQPTALASENVTNAGSHAPENREVNLLSEVTDAPISEATKRTSAPQPSTACTVDLTQPGQLADIISNALLSLEKYREDQIRTFLEQVSTKHSSGELLKAAAVKFAIDEDQLAKLVADFKHCNCNHSALPAGPIAITSNTNSSGSTASPLSAPDAIQSETPLPRIADGTHKSSAASWSLIVGLIWLSGVVLLATRSVWSYTQFLGETRHATPAPERWNSQWQTLLARHTKRRVRMLSHETLGPMLCRTPTGNVLIVPEELWDNLSPAQRGGILRHELAHLQRGDIWTGLLARVVATLHWFNPLVWLALSRFDEAAEWACDERAVQQSPQQAPAFAKALLELVQPATSPSFGTSSVQGSPLGVRIRRLVGLKTNESRWKHSSVFALLTALLALGAIQFNLTVPAMAGNSLVGSWEEGQNEPQNPTEERIEKFASRIVGTTDLAKQFAQVLNTPQGRVALANRIRSCLLYTSPSPRD